MKSKGIKNLLIDLGGVLINLDRQRCIENFQKLGLRNVEDLLDIHNPNGLLMQQEKGLITPAEFRDGVRKMIGKAVSDKQIDAAWNSFLVDIPTQKLDLLLKLREKYVINKKRFFRLDTGILYDCLEYLRFGLGHFHFKREVRFFKIIFHLKGAVRKQMSTCPFPMNLVGIAQ